VAQLTDGTTLNTGAGGDLVSDEDLTGQPRQSADVPQIGAGNANYKLERTKVAVGKYGQDRGDVDIDGRPFPVEMGVERRLMEAQEQLAIDNLATSMRTRMSERPPIMRFSARCGRAGREGV
jgi:hypothetical protein